MTNSNGIKKAIESMLTFAPASHTLPPTDSAVVECVYDLISDCNTQILKNGNDVITALLSVMNSDTKKGLFLRSLFVQQGDYIPDSTTVYVISYSNTNGVYPIFTYGALSPTSHGLNALLQIYKAYSDVNGELEVSLQQRYKILGQLPRSMRVEVESGAIAAFYLYVQNVERVREPRIPKGWSTKLQSTVKTETHEFNLALCLCRLMDKFQFEPANIEEALSEAILRFAEDISIRNMWRKVRQQLRDKYGKPVKYESMPMPITIKDVSTIETGSNDVIVAVFDWCVNKYNFDTEYKMQILMPSFRLPQHSPSKDIQNVIKVASECNIPYEGIKAMCLPDEVLLQAIYGCLSTGKASNLYQLLYIQSMRICIDTFPDGRLYLLRLPHTKQDSSMLYNPEHDHEQSNNPVINFKELKTSLQPRDTELRDRLFIRYNKWDSCPHTPNASIQQIPIWIPNVSGVNYSKEDHIQYLKGVNYLATDNTPG